MWFRSPFRARPSLVLLLAGTLGPAQTPDTVLFRRYQALAPVLEQAGQAVVAGRFGEAGRLLATCLEQIPDHFGAHFLMARMAYAGGDFSGALAHLERAEWSLAELDRRFQDRAALLKAHIAAAEREAQANLDATLARVSDPTGCSAPVLAALDRQVQEQQARKSPLQAQDSPYTIPAEYHFLHGNALWRLGQRSAAQGQYRLAIRTDPTHGNAWNNLIALHLEAGDAAQARAELARAEGAGVALSAALREAVLKPAKPMSGP